MNYFIWLLTAILYSPVLYQLYRSRWENIDYTHGYFILPVSLGLVWFKRQQLKLTLKSHPKSATAGLIILIIGLLMFAFGWRWDFLSVTTFSLILVSLGILLYIYGRAITKMLLFPVLYLLLMVPPPLGVLDSITMPMRYGVSIATEVILKLFRYPITRDGLLLSISGHEIYMGAPCSGFRSLITMIALGLVYAYLNKGTFKKKILLVISVIPLALLGNLMRVIGVCLITHHFGEKAGHTFHDIGGYAIFLVLIAGLFWVDGLLDKTLKK
jgi:exosortase